MTDYSPQEIEEKVQEYWDNNNVKQKVRESTEGNEPFFLIDGPPYLNGSPHVGHMQGKVIKDVMLRFKQMQGYDVHDQAGFDTHGLPNELATEEHLGIEDKNEIGDSISAKKFIEECKKRATSAKDDWQTVMEDLAIWQDFEDPYMTFDNDYIETAWWLLQKTDEQDLLYEGRKPIHWCPRCQTSLSGYEVTDEYQEIEDIAVFAKFPLENREEKLVIWTTTPWTIPSNMAVFTHPDYQYAIVEAEGEKLIIAEQLVSRVMEKKGLEEDDYTIERTLIGSDLKGLKYETPFIDEIPRQQELDEESGVHRVHNSEELVTLEDGTGLVHAATGHGPEDYEETRPLGLPVFSPLDSEGNYTEEAGELEGKNVLDVDPEIIEMLEDKGLLFYHESFEHEYPHCWRCKTELIYRAADQWFIENEEVKNRMLEENEDVDWIPESAQRRFGNFVSESPDWCISRQNYWGIPIPIWICNDCGEKEIIGSFDELEEHAGELPENFDPHKHVVDDISWSCGCGGEYERIPDIFDVWFDSGIAPFASLHYPFEEQPFEDMWPMDFITEASDQIRGWFYSLMFTGILGFDEAPYEKVLFQGYVLDAEGEKMSKSLGNVVDPVDQVEKFGADLPRYYSLRVAAPWEQTNYDESEIEEEIYRLLSVFWNTKEFYTTYVDERPEEPEQLEVEDEWILSRINSIAEEASEKIDDGRFHRVTRELEEFILNDLSRWYVKKVRGRVKQGDEKASWTLGQVLEKLNRLMAPFTPYITERIYQDLEGGVSVHQESYPESEERFIDEDLERYMELTREIVEKANKIRDEEEYNLRWPAKRLVISTDGETEEGLQPLLELVEEMVNVKKIEFGEVASKLSAKPDYSSLGPKFGGSADDVARKIEELEHDQVEQLRDLGEIELDGHDVGIDDVEVKSETRGEAHSKSFEEGEVFLDLEETEELVEEAFVSEVIRAIQEKRKEAGLEVHDRVKLSFQGAEDVLGEYTDRVEKRMNVDEIVFGEELDYSGEVSHRDLETVFSFSGPVE
ncbi:isoleucine--tRNA ligase [Candidatus Nanosalina sp. VS9-1]|uniref:isoleucine--tRNA ligase n=1 Tax=Candidatus Nanosalina sp. VS9-1 TaxID=3388566 RepID=UPI0039E01980